MDRYLCVATHRAQRHQYCVQWGRRRNEAGHDCQSQGRSILHCRPQALILRFPRPDSTSSWTPPPSISSFCDPGIWWRMLRGHVLPSLVRVSAPWSSYGKQSPSSCPISSSVCPLEDLLGQIQGLNPTPNRHHGIRIHVPRSFDPCPDSSRRIYPLPDDKHRHVVTRQVKKKMAYQLGRHFLILSTQLCEAIVRIHLTSFAQQLSDVFQVLSNLHVLLLSLPAACFLSYGQFVMDKESHRRYSAPFRHNARHHPLLPVLVRLDVYHAE